MASEDITKVAEIYQIYLNDAMLWLTFRIKKSEVDEIEDKFQENRRKSMKGRH